jgi:hypothetical protein
MRRRDTAVRGRPDDADARTVIADRERLETAAA